jgi:hypothetical protein
MVTQAEKARLWAKIRVEYPDFGQGLQAAKKADSDHVPIDSYSRATNTWLLTAIRGHNMALYRLIKDRMMPDKQFAKKLFNATITVAIDDLIPALVTFEGQHDDSSRQARAVG